MSMYVHVEHTRTFKEEVVVKRRHVKPVLQQGRHYGIHLVFEQHKVAHHHFVSACALGHGEPTAKAEGRWSSDAVYSNFEIVPRDIDLQNVGLEIALLLQCFEYGLVVSRHALGEQ